MSLKNTKFITDPDSKHNIEVTLIPLGNKIKYRLTGKVYCNRQNSELQNSGTFLVDDLVWNAVFGSRIKTKKFIKNNRTVKKVMPISYLGYERCDSIK